MAKVSTQESKTWNITFETVRPKFHWEWKLPYGNSCAICRNSVMELSAKTNDRTVCAPVVGVCGHTFHKDCITSWINTRHNTKCPVCKQNWQIKKIEEKKDKKEDKDCLEKKTKQIMEKINSLVNNSDNLDIPITHESIQSLISNVLTNQSTQTNENNSDSNDFDSMPELESVDSNDDIPELVDSSDEILEVN